MSVRLAPIRSEMRPNRMVNGIATMFKASTSAMVTVVLMRITEVRKAGFDAVHGVDAVEEEEISDQEGEEDPESEDLTKVVPTSAMESLIAPKKPSTSCGLGTSGSGTTKNIRIPNPSHRRAGDEHHAEHPRLGSDTDDHPQMDDHDDDAPDVSVDVPPRGDMVHRLSARGTA